VARRDVDTRCDTGHLVEFGDGDRSTRTHDEGLGVLEGEAEEQRRNGIVDVDVVAHLGAVAVDLDARACECCLHHAGDDGVLQLHLGAVDVGESIRHRADAVRRTVGRQQHLRCCLRGAVGREGSNGKVLGNGLETNIANDRIGRGEDEASNVVLPACFEQVVRHHHVGLEDPFGIVDALEYRGDRCEVHHRIDAGRETGVDRRLISEISRHLLDVMRLEGERKQICDEWRVASFEEVANDVVTEKP